MVAGLQYGYAYDAEMMWAWYVYTMDIWGYKTCMRWKYGHKDIR